MHMQHSREFLILADTCSYMEAAEALFMAQSTLSRHIQRLEEELGKPLFSRNTRKVELTEFGRWYYDYAKRVVDIEDECEAALHHEQDLRSNHLYCALQAALAKYGVHKILQRVQTENPNIYIALTISKNGADCLEQLRLGKCGMAMLREMEKRPDNDFARYTWLSDPMVLLVPPNHRFAGEPSIHYAQLAEEPMILPPETSILHKKYSSACRKAGFVPKIGQIAYPSETVLDMVSMGLGATVMPLGRVQHLSSSSFRVVRLYPEEFTYLNVLYPAHVGQPEALKLALSYLRAAAPAGEDA